MGDPPCWQHLFEDDGRSGTISDGAAAQLLRELNDAVVVADDTETIVFWNQAAERVFGWSTEQAVGQPLEMIIPDRHRATHSAGYSKVMASGETRYADQLLRVPANHRDGDRRSIAFTVTLLKDPSGKVQGIAAVIRDETERWAEEKQLKAKLRETG